MAEPYKLKDEIKQFIIEKKKANPKLSCRSITPLIKETFSINLSKSTINAIIKENSLSNKVGRPRIRPKLLPKSVEQSLYKEIPPQTTAIPPEVKVIPPEVPVPLPEAPVAAVLEPVESGVSAPKYPLIEKKSIRENGKSYYLENGGALILIVADQKSGLTDFVAGKLAAYLPDISKDIVRMLIRAKIYSQIFKDKGSPWGLLGKELICADPGVYYEQINNIPLNQLDMDFFSLGLEHNINEANRLYQQCLSRLNSLVQTFFFPSVYQFLDLKTMHYRFYSLIAQIEVKGGLIDTQFFYQENFQLVHDIVWQEDFKFVIDKINSEKIFAEGEQFRFDENIGLLNVKTVSFA